MIDGLLLMHRVVLLVVEILCISEPLLRRMLLPLDGRVVTVGPLEGVLDAPGDRWHQRRPGRRQRRRGRP